ncbi:hypothetical protein BDV12DRAFT_180249 [Aspergillus spectabilis]
MWSAPRPGYRSIYGPSIRKSSKHVGEDGRPHTLSQPLAETPVLEQSYRMRSSASGSLLQGCNADSSRLLHLLPLL